MRDWERYVRDHLRLTGFAPEREQRIIREIASQLEDFCRDGLARGMAEHDADGFARRQIPDWASMAEDVRRADRRQARPRLARISDHLDTSAGGSPGGLQMLAETIRDGRHALRQLTGSPAFAAIAILTIALGTGATTAIYSVVNGVLLRPLPYAEPDRLVRVHEILPTIGRFPAAPASFVDWQRQNRSFEALAAYSTDSATLGTGEGPERVPDVAASAGLFDVLGVRPVLGRTFTADEDRPGNGAVLVLSHGMWQRRFGGDPSALGATVSIDGSPWTIIGVMPAGFYFPTREAEFWVPLALGTANLPRGAHYLGVVGRTRAGVSAREADAEMKDIAGRLARQYPESSAGESALVVPLHDQIVGNIRPALLTLLAAVSVVVLIACANVANLLLVRATVREKEVAIRAALGASRRRLVLQMLAESLVLAAAGGLVGMLLAYLAVEPIRTLSAGGIPRVADVTVDGRVLLFALAVSLTTGMVFGLAPAWHASRPGLSAVLKEGGRPSSASRGRWLRNTLLVVEVALSVVLLVGAALLLRSFERISGVDPGFRTDHVLAFRVALPATSYPQASQKIAFFDALLEKLGALPGVDTAGMTQSLPLRGGYLLAFTVQGDAFPAGTSQQSASYRAVSPDYFRALGIPLLRGRAFSHRDTAVSPMVAIVDDAFADRHFGGRDPIGQRMSMGNGSEGFYEIVGVVGSVRHSGLDTPPDPTMYVPYGQDVFSTMWIVVKGGGDPSLLSSAARHAVLSLDRNLPAYSTMPLAAVVSDSVARRRFSMLLLVAFAGIALFLACVGLYGLVAYTVSQRTREIGVRMAMGADGRTVLRMIVGDGMRLALYGVLTGLAGALLLARVVRSMLFGVTPLDPASYAGTSALLLGLAALACYVPARRATAVDPLVALRSE